LVDNDSYDIIMAQNLVYPRTKKEVTMGGGGGVVGEDDDRRGREEIEEIIPHRSPFLFLREVYDLVPGESGVGVFNPEDYPWITEGHFPGNEVVPGFITAEAMAQTGAVILLCQEEYEGRGVRLLGADKLKWRSPIVPDEAMVRLHVTIQKTRKVGDSVFGTATGKAFINREPKPAFSGEVKFALVNEGE